MCVCAQALSQASQWRHCQACWSSLSRAPCSSTTPYSASCLCAWWPRWRSRLSESEQQHITTLHMWLPFKYPHLCLQIPLPGLSAVRALSDRQHQLHSLHLLCYCSWWVAWCCLAVQSDSETLKCKHPVDEFVFPGAVFYLEFKNEDVLHICLFLLGWVSPLM